MEAHRSFKTSERLAPLAIISSVRFSAASRDSACDGVVVFGPCFDTDPLGCVTPAAALSCISWCGLKRDSEELFIPTGCFVSQAHHARPVILGAKTVPLFQHEAGKLPTTGAVTDPCPPRVWMTMGPFGRIFHVSEARSQLCAVGRTIISPTSTLAGCSIANAMARAIASAGI